MYRQWTVFCVVTGQLQRLSSRLLTHNCDGHNIHDCYSLYLPAFLRTVTIPMRSAYTYELKNSAILIFITLIRDGSKCRLLKLLTMHVSPHPITQDDPCLPCHCRSRLPLPARDRSQSRDLRYRKKHLSSFR